MIRGIPGPAVVLEEVGIIQTSLQETGRAPPSAGTRAQVGVRDTGSSKCRNGSMAERLIRNQDTGVRIPLPAFGRPFLRRTITLLPGGGKDGHRRQMVRMPVQLRQAVRVRPRQRASAGSIPAGRINIGPVGPLLVLSYKGQYAGLSIRMSGFESPQDRRGHRLSFFSFGGTAFMVFPPFVFFGRKVPDPHNVIRITGKTFQAFPPALCRRSTAFPSSNGQGVIPKRDGMTGMTRPPQEKVRSKTKGPPSKRRMPSASFFYKTGWMSERPMVAVSKTAVGNHRGFESLSSRSV